MESVATFKESSTVTLREQKKSGDRHSGAPLIPALGRQGCSGVQGHPGLCSELQDQAKLQRKTCLKKEEEGKEGGKERRGEVGRGGGEGRSRNLSSYIF